MKWEKRGRIERKKKKKKKRNGKKNEVKTWCEGDWKNEVNFKNGLKIN